MRPLLGRCLGRMSKQGAPNISPPPDNLLPDKKQGKKFNSCLDIQACEHNVHVHFQILWLNFEDKAEVTIMNLLLTRT